MERARVQHDVRRHLQRVAAAVGRALRMAPPGVLPQIAMVPFSKAHAYGNDFLYVRVADLAGREYGAAARRLCHRHTGIGADGLIVYEPTARGASMTLHNADGGKAELSGNGLRALAALIVRDRQR